MVDLREGEPLLALLLKMAERKFSQCDSAARGEDKLSHLQVVPADVNR